MASNVQRGPTRMDASDWTRVKKLNGARGNMLYVYGTPSPMPNPTPYNDVVNPAPITQLGVGKYTEFGISKIRRPASNYTDYRAAQTADYVLQSITAISASTLTVNKICRCATSDAIKHNGVCVICK
jgi:hypothetical protein